MVNGLQECMMEPWEPRRVVTATAKAGDGGDLGLGAGGDGEK